MTAKFDSAIPRVMHTRSGPSGDDEVVVVDFRDEEIVVTWPRPLGMFEAFELNSHPPLPSPLIARDGGGWLTLVEGRSAGLSMSTMAHSEQKLFYRAAIATGGEGADYTELNGMEAEVEGLARWAKISTVATEMHFDDESHGPLVSLSAKNQPVHRLGGPLDVHLATSFRHQPYPDDGNFTIVDRLTVRTLTSRRRAWSSHAEQHRMIQDLMCLVYSHPCTLELKSVMRRDDQPHYKGKKGVWWWPDAHEPHLGRSSGSKKSLDKREPLFYLDETDGKRLNAWLTQSHSWSRPTWIAVTTLFQSNSTVEARLLQVGVALEALGYAIWRQSHPTASRTPTYPDLLKHVTRRVGISSTTIFGGSGRPDRWVRSFNEAFKGAKHADKPLVPTLLAHERAEQGFLLIRCWLALELGVPRTLIRERLDEVTRGRRR